MNRRLQKKRAKQERRDRRKPVTFRMVHVSDSEMAICPIITTVRFRRYGSKHYGQ